MSDHKPCPACPDGSVWNSDGPTSAICPVCKGHAPLPPLTHQNLAWLTTRATLDDARTYVQEYAQLAVRVALSRAAKIADDETALTARRIRAMLKEYEG